MDLLSVLRMLGALLFVLGLLGGALWAVRRFDIRLPGRTGAFSARRLEVVERETIDTRRSLTLIRRDGREHLILLSPEGNLVVESGIVRDEIDDVVMAERRRLAEQRKQMNDAAVAQAREDIKAMRASFASLVDAKSQIAREKIAKAASATSSHLQKAAKGADSLRLKARELANAAGLLETEPKVVAAMTGAGETTSRREKPAARSNSQSRKGLSAAKRKQSTKVNGRG